MKKFSVCVLTLVLTFFAWGIVSAEEAGESITLEESLRGLELGVRVVRKAAIEEGYSWEEARMVAITAMEGLKEGLEGEELALKVRERSRERIKEGGTMLKTRKRSQMRTRAEEGNMPDDVKRYLNRKEEVQREDDKSRGK